MRPNVCDPFICPGTACDVTCEICRRQICFCTVALTVRTAGFGLLWLNSGAAKKRNGVGVVFADR